MLTRPEKCNCLPFQNQVYLLFPFTCMLYRSIVHSFAVISFDHYKDTCKNHDVEAISLDVEAKNASQFDQKQFYTWENIC